MLVSQLKIRNIILLVFFVLILISYGCGKSEAPLSPWIPNIPGASESNHNESVRIERTTLPPQNAKIISSNGPLNTNDEISFDIPMEQDLGDYGSISLIAEPQVPSSIRNKTFLSPVLVSLQDGFGNDFVNLSKTAYGDYCGGSGIKSPHCSLQFPSSFTNMENWRKNQSYEISDISVITFPKCNWTGFQSNCPFNTHFFEPGTTRLRTGHGATYKAKYLLVSTENIGINLRTPVQLTVVKKFAADSNKKAIDFNVILVGSKNIHASQTEQGQKNLNALFTHVQKHFSQPSADIKIGKINVIEWNKDRGGDAYAFVSAFNSEYLFKKGSTLVPPNTEGKAINIYFVSGFTEGTVVGRAGQINGPMINGTETSGIVVATFNKLDKFNKNCSGQSVCEFKNQDAFFIDMASTISHETGHFLGLFHTSERKADDNDGLPDTPHCTRIKTRGMLTHDDCRYDINKHPITGLSCSEVCPGYNGRTRFCPTQAECEFNHVMWWTTKYYDPATEQGDGNIFSTSSGIILNYNPFVQ